VNLSPGKIAVNATQNQYGTRTPECVFPLYHLNPIAFQAVVGSDRS